jgi:hypothetical protein
MIFMETRSPGAEFRDNQPPLASVFCLHDLPEQESGISRMFSFGAAKYFQCGGSYMTTKRTAMFTAFAVLIFLLSFFAIQPVKADTITLASTGTSADAGQTNSMGATIAIVPNSSWAAALPGSSWVSFAQTSSASAPGYVQVANGTVVDFYDTFTISGTPSGGTLTVMGDDSAAVLLNGTQLIAEASPIGNTYRACSDFGIGCLMPTTITIPASDLQNGANTLEFEVGQRNGYSFGLDYLGSVINPAIASEPAAGLMLGLGLLALSAIALRRRRLNA